MQGFFGNFTPCQPRPAGMGYVISAIDGYLAKQPA
ncbi:MAG: hypothetical protein JWQ95_5501 [Sphaerisporangium sp.]|nr:hypothetical protein [Sphaerisporangium sp.]